MRSPRETVSAARFRAARFGRAVRLTRSQFLLTCPLPNPSAVQSPRPWPASTSRAVRRCRKVVASISSGAALKGYAGWSLYCATKAGLEGFVRALALEQQPEPHPLLAVSIDPGVVDTQMQALIRTMSKRDFPEVERFIRRKNEGGLSAPSRVAAAVLRVLSAPTLVGGQRYEAVSE